MRVHLNLSACCFLVTCCVFLSGCFPGKVANIVEGEGLQRLRIDSQKGSPQKATSFRESSKVFTADGSVYLFPKGFTVSLDSIAGNGAKFAFGEDVGFNGRYAILRDSVVALTYYEEKHTFGEVFGSAMLGPYGGLVSYLALACLSCPKCCFGSCPTIYVESDSLAGIRAECFSYCVSPFIQRPDLDLLQHDADRGQKFRLRVTNEALESHMINRLELLSVSHPADSRVYPTADGRILAVRNLKPVMKAWAKSGTYISEQIRAIDEDAYRSGLDRFADLTESKQRDAITFEVPAKPGQDSVTVVLCARNTLLSTSLFYDVVLGSRGLNALTWTARMAEDEQYAHLFYALYDQYAGVQVEVERNGEFVQAGSLGDIGPIAWKEMALRIPATGSSTRVRLSFFPDNLAIDYIAYAEQTLRENAFFVHSVEPEEITDCYGASRLDLLSKVAAQDENYLHSTPGDSFLFSYTLPDRPGMKTTVLLGSQGYYYEWLRGNWVRNENVLPPLNIFDVPGILQTLRERWLSDSPMMETEFFQNRVPLKERHI